MSRPRYTVTASREGGWWELDVEGLENVFAQARRLDQAEDMARDVIAAMLDIPEDSFDIEIHPTIDRTLDEAIAFARAARQLAANAQEAARASTGSVAGHLHRHGLPVRDIGKILGVSHQRAAKILKEGSGDALPLDKDIWRIKSALLNDDRVVKAAIPAGREEATLASTRTGEGD